MRSAQLRVQMVPLRGEMVCRGWRLRGWPSMKPTRSHGRAQNPFRRCVYIGRRGA